MPKTKYKKSLQNSHSRIQKLLANSHLKVIKMKRVAKYFQEYCPHFSVNIRQMNLYKQIKCFYMSNMTKQYKHTIKYLDENEKRTFLYRKMCAAIDTFLFDFYCMWCSYLMR